MSFSKLNWTRDLSNWNKVKNYWQKSIIIYEYFTRNVKMFIQVKENYIENVEPESSLTTQDLNLPKLLQPCFILLQNCKASVQLANKLKLLLTSQAHHRHCRRAHLVRRRLAYSALLPDVSSFHHVMAFYLHQMKKHSWRHLASHQVWHPMVQY